MRWSPGYETDERSLLGKRGEHRRWREERPERSAAVGLNQCLLRQALIYAGYRKPGRYAEPMIENVRHKDKTSLADPTIKTPDFERNSVFFSNFWANLGCKTSVVLVAVLSHPL